MSGRRSAQPTSKERGLLAYLGWGVSIGLFSFVLLIGVLAIGVPWATGSTPMTVLTSSMAPTYPPGTLIIVKPIDSADIRLGMPLTYQLESGKDIFVTHRVVAIKSVSDGAREFVMRGDANSADDQAPVKAAQVRGEVWYSIPYLGWVNNAVNGENRVWVIPVIAGGLFLYAGYTLASSIASKTRRARSGRKTGMQVQDVADVSTRPDIR